MNDKDDSNDFMKVLSAFRDIEAMLHGEEETVALPVRDLIDLFPEDYISMDDPSAVPEGKATIKIDNLFFQLSKGKVEVPVSALAIALPAQFIRPQALEDEHTMIRLPLQAVVKAIDPDVLKGKMAPKTTRHQAMNIPDPFGPKSEPKPESAPAVPVPPAEEIAPSPPPEPPVEEAEPAQPEREPESVSEPSLAPEATSLPEPPAEPEPVEEAVAESEPVAAAEPPPEPSAEAVTPSPLQPEEPQEDALVSESAISEPAESDREPESAAEPPFESKPAAPPATVYDSIRSVFARPKTAAEALQESPSEPETPEEASPEAPEPEPLACDEPDDFGGVNLNTATVEQLMTLDGVTDLVAETVLQYRRENGEFKSIFELGKIPRVGRKTFRKMTGMPYSMSHRHRRLKLAGLLNMPPESIGRLSAIAQRLASRPGFSGCVVSNAEGLVLAEHGASEYAEKLGAVMPRLARQIGENVGLLEMGAVESVSICLKNRMFTVAVSGDICLTVMHKRNTLTRSQLVLVRKTAEELAWLLSHRAYVGRG